MQRKTIVLILVNVVLVLLLLFGDKLASVSSAAKSSTSAAAPTLLAHHSPSSSINNAAPQEASRSEHNDQRSIQGARKGSNTDIATSVLEDDPVSPNALTVEGGGGLIGGRKQLASHCFRNRIMWQPSMCSNMFEVLGKFLDRRKELGMADRHFQLAHIGARDGIYKVAEMSETFGNVAHGTHELGQLLFKIRGPKEFCGFCCECVSRDPGEETRAVIPHNITFLRPGEPLDSQIIQQLGPYVNVKPLPPNTMTRCPQKLIDEAVESLGVGKSSVDVLTLDAWTCDAEIVERAIIKGSVRPIIFQMTLVNSAKDYEAFLDGLLRVGYHCYYHTTKPTRVPRGMRHPIYPMTILVSGCWRDVYGVFKGDRFHLTCTSLNNTAASSTLTLATRTVHKGMFTGCMIVGRPQRLAKWKQELGH